MPSPPPLHNAHVPIDTSPCRKRPLTAVCLHPFPHPCTHAARVHITLQCMPSALSPTVIHICMHACICSPCTQYLAAEAARVKQRRHSRGVLARSCRGRVKGRVGWQERRVEECEGIQGQLGRKCPQHFALLAVISVKVPQHATCVQRPTRHDSHGSIALARGWKQKAAMPSALSTLFSTLPHPPHLRSGPLG